MHQHGNQYQQRFQEAAKAEEQAAQYKKRARNTVIFYVIAESIWQIKDLILYYYS